MNSNPHLVQLERLFVFPLLRFRALSLRRQIVIIVCAASLLTSVVLGTVSLVFMTGASEDWRHSRASDEARMVGARISDQFDQLGKDVVAASSSLALGRLVALDREDPLYPKLRAELEDHFISIMQANPEYTQVRLIDLDSEGHELVRVEKANGALNRTPQASLQAKGEEPYFEAAKQIPQGRAGFSRITFNREYGEIIEPATLTARAFAAVFDPRGARVAFLIINADFGQLVRPALEFSPGPGNPSVLDPEGSFVVRPGGAVRSSFLSNQEQAELAQALRDMNARTQISMRDINGETIFYHRFPVTPDNPDLELLLRTHALPEARHPALELGLVLLAGGLIVGVIALFSTTRLAAWVTRPLARLLEEVRAGASAGRRSFLPNEALGETGELSRAFSALLKEQSQSERKLRNILESVVDALIVIDEAGTIDTVNSGCCKLFGYSRKELIGRNVSILMPEPDRGRHDGYLANHRQTGVKKIIGVGREVEARKKNGEVFPAALTVAEVPLNHRRMFCGTLRDITARKQVAALKDEFVSTVNHELRTPLSTVYGALRVVHENQAQHMDTFGQHFIQLALSGCEQLTTLVDDILDLEKVAAGKIAFETKQYDLGDLVREVVRRHELIASKRDVHVEMKFEDNLGQVLLDPNRFSQALGNVLANACKYSPEGDCIEVTITEEIPGWLRVAVEDNGPGIPRSFQPHVFERFAQADGSTTREKGGSGLGLAISLALIEAMGGAMTFDTEPGSGTKFYIYLPIAEEEGVAT